MDNNIRNIKKELRSFAKRCKNIKFNEGLLLAFLMTGMLAFTKNTSVSEGIDATKQEISTSISDLKAVFREAKRENNKLLKDSNLELIQLMEQGDQVVKSPWSSWQFGMNYYYSGWNGVYKGMGDKAEKYPYEGVYTRSSDPFLRSISPYSRNYSRYTTSVSAAEKATVNSATTSISGLTDPSWGIESSVFDQEPILTLNLLATIKPKEINKVVPTVDLGNIEGPGDVSFSITPPNVSPGKPEMKTLTFNYSPPSTHTKPGYTGFNMKFEKFVDDIQTNASASSHGSYVEGKSLTFSGNTDTYITPTSSVSFISGAAPGVTVPQNPNYVRGNNRPAVIKGGVSNNPFKIYFEANGNVAVNQNLVIDSSAYRIDENNGSKISGYTSGGTASTTIPAVKDRAFLIGGSRVGSLNAASGTITNSKNIGLAGPLVAGFEIQTNSTAGTRELNNTGTISDAVENTSYRGEYGLGGLLVPVQVTDENNNIKYYIPGVYGTTSGVRKAIEYAPGDKVASITFTDNSEIGAITIERKPDVGKIEKDSGGNETLVITNYSGGYTGYKTGLVLTADQIDAGGSNNWNNLINEGKISFVGHHSIGIQVDADNSPDANVKVLNKNGANITLSGGTSYGMKLSSAVSDESTMKNEGTITLDGSNSAGIAVMEDYSGSSTNTTKSDVRAWGNSTSSTYNVENLATTGIINVGAGNSIGMYLKLNRADAIANRGKINVEGHSVSSGGTTTYYGSVGMRVDRGSYSGGTVTAGAPIIDNLKDINVNHINSMGMVAVGNGVMSTAIANNKDDGIITLKADSTVGMFAENGGEINNKAITTGTGTVVNRGILGTNLNNSVGMYISDNTSKGTNTGTIKISGLSTSSTPANVKGVVGVYNLGNFEMSGSTSEIEISGINSTAVYANGPTSSVTTKIKEGTINITGGSSTYGGIGLYAKNNAEIELGETATPTINVNSNALMFYNYDGNPADNTSLSREGKLKLHKDVTANINSGGSAFYFKNIYDVSQLNAALTDSLTASGSQKLNVNLKNGSTLFIIRNFNPSSGTSNIKLSDLSSLGTSGILSVIPAASANFKYFKTIGGHLFIDSTSSTPQTYTLDTGTAYDKVEFVSSSVTVNSDVTIKGGSNAGRTAIGQRNEFPTSSNSALVVTNNGTIEMSNNKNGSISSTAIAVERGTAINNDTSSGAVGSIKMTGDSGIGMYGATNSILINNGTIGITENGAGMVGANYLTYSGNANQSITITNNKKIEALLFNGALAKKVIGIYANNSPSSSATTSTSNITHAGTLAAGGGIDLTSATASLGIYAGKSNVTSTGDIKIGDNNAGINGVTSNVTITAGEYILGEKSIGFILQNFGGANSGYFETTTTGKVKLTKGDSTVYYLENSTADTAIAAGTAGHFSDKLQIDDTTVSVSPSNKVAYTYIFAKGSNLKYDNGGTMPATITKDKVIFINASPSYTKNPDGTETSTVDKQSIIELGTTNKIELLGANSIATYLKNGISATNKGTITLTGDKSVALYGEGGGRLENAASTGIISVGQNSVGMYNKGTTTAVNNGEIKLTGDFGIGMRSDSASGTSTNTGKIISTNLRAVGMSASGGSNALENTGEINLSGQESIGIHTDKLGTGHEITNGSSGKIILTDATNETKPNIGIYSDNAGDVIKNNGEITAGDQTIGVYSKAGGNVTLGGLSKTTVGQNAMGVYTTGGTVTIDNGAAITVGDRISAGKESVGVFYAGSNGTINNSTANITIGEGSIGFVMKGGSGNTLTSDNPSNGTVTLKKESVFIYDDTQSTVNNRTHLSSSAATDERIYGIYTNGKGSNYGNIDFSLGKGNVGIYSYLYDPNYTNNVNEKGEYIARNKPGAFVNHGIISVSESDITPPNLEDKKYGIGMAAGYVKQRLVYNSTTNQTEVKRDVLGLGHIENYGTIRVTTPNSIGMYAGGKGSKAINHVTGRIELSGTELNVGMFLEDGAEGHNYGTITTVGSGNKEQVGIAVLREATFHNHPGGKVYINAEDGIGIAIGGRVTLVNRGEFVISADQKTATINGDSEAVKADGDGAVAIAVISDGSKIMGISPVNQVGIIHNDGTYDATITYNGVPVPYVQTVDAISSLNPGTGTIQTSSIGLYMDTSGVNATKPVNGIGNLATGMGLKYVDLIVGTEATEHTNEKYLKLSEDLINPYNNMILEAQTHGLRRWQIYSNSLTWMAKAEQNTDTQLIENMYLVKVPYTVWSGQLSSPVNSSDTYNFLDGLDQRYGVEALGTREREVFTKLNSIGNNEHILLSQAFDEMMGHQYGNTQQRMIATGSILDKEFTHLKKEWETKSKESNKIKTFGSRGEYKSNTAGIIDYTNNAYGVAYVHEDETIKLGNSTGWYAGVVYNQFKLKDIGRSKENTTMLKAGIFKTKAFDHNGSLKWTISGEGYVSRSDMDRRFLVVDEIFSAQSDYYTYGVALKNELSKEFRTSERTSITPYGSLKMEYGKFNGIKEDTGEIRLEIESNGYYSIKPELGIEFKYKQPMAVRTSLITTLGLAYETELGKTAEVGNRGRVRFTSADWFGIREEKEDRKGNFKADLNLGIENERVGFTLNLGYDTKGENVRGGIGFRAIY